MAEIRTSWGWQFIHVYPIIYQVFYILGGSPDFKTSSCQLPPQQRLRRVFGVFSHPGCSRDGCSKWGAAASDAADGATAAHGAGGCN